MRLMQNRVTNDDLHEELLRIEPFPAITDGHFCGELILNENFAEDDNDVSAYSFRIDDIVQQFIDDNIIPKTGKFDKRGQEDAIVLVSCLDSMRDRVLERMQK